jgi:hypothetical protein
MRRGKSQANTTAERFAEVHKSKQPAPTARAALFHATPIAIIVRTGATFHSGGSVAM